MTTKTKHVGKAGSRDCVVVYRQVPPNEPDNCLVVYIDALEDRVQEEFLNTVHSIEAQDEPELFNVLFRKSFSDGKNMLYGLHQSNKLTKLGTNQVMLAPQAGTLISLEEVNKEIDKINSGITLLKTEVNPDIYGDTTRFNPNDLKTDEDKENAAKTLLYQAEQMRQDGEQIIEEARVKREEAYNLSPDLRPAKKLGRPKKAKTIAQEEAAAEEEATSPAPPLKLGEWADDES